MTYGSYWDGAAIFAHKSLKYSNKYKKNGIGKKIS